MRIRVVVGLVPQVVQVKPSQGFEGRWFDEPAGFLMHLPSRSVPVGLSWLAAAARPGVGAVRCITDHDAVADPDDAADGGDKVISRLGGAEVGGDLQRHLTIQPRQPPDLCRSGGIQQGGQVGMALAVAGPCPHAESFPTRRPGGQVPGRGAPEKLSAGAGAGRDCGGGGRWAD
jgi:hypothetical protein